MLHGWNQKRAVLALRGGMESGEGDGLQATDNLHPATRGRRLLEGGRLEVYRRAWRRELEC